MPDSIEQALDDLEVVETSYRTSLSDHERVAGQRKRAILRAVDAGATYAAIGEVLGCSKQYVAKLAADR